jgi:hypothetical protein
LPRALYRPGLEGQALLAVQLHMQHCQQVVVCVALYAADVVSSCQPACRETRAEQEAEQQAHVSSNAKVANMCLKCMWYAHSR